jgi:hypothetical protein
MSEWTPQNDQAPLTLAAIRWYALSIEKLATDIYLTNPGLYKDVQPILTKCFRDLGAIRKRMYAEFVEEARQTAAQTEAQQTQPTARPLYFDGRCPPGYVNCWGVCLPDCDEMEAY